MEVALDIVWILQWGPNKGNEKAKGFMVDPEMVNVMERIEGLELCNIRLVFLTTRGYLGNW